MDYEVQRCTRRCAKTHRVLEPGENYFSTLIVEGAKVVRYDFAEEAWSGPPDGSLGWWKSRVPTGESKRASWAPSDVMLDLFDELEHQADKQDLRYVLALLLVRRRVLRLEDTVHAEPGVEQLVVRCPRRETTYRLAVMDPSEARVQVIQDELAALFMDGGS
jgi:hypothetical protein